jgi:UDP-galactopyranose mutase
MVYSLPVNLLTINQFFHKVMGPDDARAFVASKTRQISNPAFLGTRSSRVFEQKASVIGCPRPFLRFKEPGC